MTALTTKAKRAADRGGSPWRDVRRQSYVMLRWGIVLMLLASVEGVAIPSLPAPQLGVTAHTLGYTLGTLSLAMGLIWPKLDLGRNASRIALWAFLYSALALVAAYMVAAVLRAGASSMPLAAAGARGTPTQEMLIAALLASASVTFLVSLGCVLWGLRAQGRAEGEEQPE